MALMCVLEFSDESRHHIFIRTAAVTMTDRRTDRQTDRQTDRLPGVVIHRVESKRMLQ